MDQGAGERSGKPLDGLTVLPPREPPPGPTDRLKLVTRVLRESTGGRCSLDHAQQMAGPALLVLLVRRESRVPDPRADQRGDPKARSTLPCVMPEETELKEQ